MIPGRVWRLVRDWTASESKPMKTNVYVTDQLNGCPRTWDAKLVGVGPARPRRAGAKLSRVEASRAEAGRAEPGHAFLGRAKPSRAEPSPSRTEPSRAKRNQAEPARDPKLNFVPAGGEVILVDFFRYLPHGMLTFWTPFPRTPPADLGHKIGGPSRAELRPRPSQAEPSRAVPGRAGPGHAWPGRAESS